MVVMSAHPSDPSVDPAIAEAVQNVSNRFGVAGLEEMIAVAKIELQRARAALAELGPETS